MKGSNDIVADPRFVRFDADLRKADFRIQNDSRARVSAMPELLRRTDLKGLNRPLGKPDRDAYEK